MCSGIEISLVDWTRKCEAHLSAWRKDVINAIVASPVYGTHAVDHISRSCDSQCQIVLRCVETIVRLKPLSKPSSLQTLLDSCELLIKDQVQQDSVALRAVAWRDSTLQVPNYVKWELNSIPMVSLLEVRESLLKLY